jgi:hypothetical protein
MLTRPPRLRRPRAALLPPPVAQLHPGALDRFATGARTHRESRRAEFRRQQAFEALLAIVKEQLALSVSREPIASDDTSASANADADADADADDDDADASVGADSDAASALSDSAPAEADADEASTDAAAAARDARLAHLDGARAGSPASRALNATQLAQLSAHVDVVLSGFELVATLDDKALVRGGLLAARPAPLASFALAARCPACPRSRARQRGGPRHAARARMQGSSPRHPAPRRARRAQVAELCRMLSLPEGGALPPELDEALSLAVRAHREARAADDALPHAAAESSLTVDARAEAEAAGLQYALRLALPYVEPLRALPAALADTLATHADGNSFAVLLYALLRAVGARARLTLGCVPPDDVEAAVAEAGSAAEREARRDALAALADAQSGPALAAGECALFSEVRIGKGTARLEAWAAHILAHYRESRELHYRTDREVRARARGAPPILRAHARARTRVRARALAERTPISGVSRGASQTARARAVADRRARALPRAPGAAPRRGTPGSTWTGTTSLKCRRPARPTANTARRSTCTPTRGRTAGGRATSR